MGEPQNNVRVNGDCFQVARISTSSVVQSGETAYPIRDLDAESREQRSEPYKDLNEFRGRMKP